MLIKQIGNKGAALVHHSSRLVDIARMVRKPSHCRVILADAFNKAYSQSSDEAHLRGAMDWLCRAQDVTACGGVSAGYSLVGGWRPPYPETTGYIIGTFLQYAALTGEADYTERALKMGDWELDIQLSTGAVRGGQGVNEYPIVFNTGQVVLGWTSLYESTRLPRFLEGAAKAAEWLISIQDPDGKWSAYTYNGFPHTYHTRVCWALLRVYSLTQDEKYLDAAEANLSWTLSKVSDNGWIRNMSMSSLEDRTALTHTIAYTLRGLLESSSFLSEAIRLRSLEVVEKAAIRLLREYELRKSNPYSVPDYLQATFDDNWRPVGSHSCLTGNAQIAIVWMKLFNMNGDGRLLNGALKLVDQLKGKQLLRNGFNSDIRGAIPGSHRLWGAYQSWSYPNWATKFFADAIMCQEATLNGLAEKSE